jgi:hypothetical protein
MLHPPTTEFGPRGRGAREWGELVGRGDGAHRAAVTDKPILPSRHRV